MAGKPGGILGLGLAVVLVGALAGSPFYLRMLRSDDRALAEAASADSDTLRRAVANLDHELALLNYMMHSGDDPEGIDSAVGFRFARENPGIWNREVMRESAALVEELTAIENRDMERNTTVLGKGTVSRVNPRGEDVLREALEPLKAGQSILSRADTAMNQIRSLTVGSASASNSLDVNRVRSLYLMAKARLEVDKARFERSQASILRTGVEQRATSLGKTRSVLTALEARQTETIIQQKQESLARADAGSQQAAQAMAGLEALIASRKAEMNSLLEEADQARSELAELAASGNIDSQSDRYAALSKKAREAEAAAAAIQNGTLRGATEVAADDREFAGPAYEGGTPEPGIGVLEFRLEQLRQQTAALNSMRESLTKEIAALQETAEATATSKAQIAEGLQAEVARIDEQLAQASQRVKNAEKSEDAALKLLKEAALAAKSAVGAAKKRTSDAMQGAGSGESVDERLQRVSQDHEAEAYVQTLVGNALFASAAVRFDQIQGMLAEKKIAAYVAQLSGADEPGSVSEDVEKQKTEVINELAEAAKAYQQVATLINRVNLRFPDNTPISGKNYVWEAQVGEAACLLLDAAIKADDADASFESQSKAYDLLKEAVEKREQSPLLGSALDAILYLQKTAR